MSYTTATVDFTYRRDARLRSCIDSLPAPQFLRNFAAIEGRRQLLLSRDGPHVCICSPCMVGAALGEGGKGGAAGTETLGCTLTDRLTE